MVNSTDVLCVGKRGRMARARGAKENTRAARPSIRAVLAALGLDFAHHVPPLYVALAFGERREQGFVCLEGHLFGSVIHTLGEQASKRRAAHGFIRLGDAEEVLDFDHLNADLRSEEHTSELQSR